MDANQMLMRLKRKQSQPFKYPLIYMTSRRLLMELITNTKFLYHTSFYIPNYKDTLVYNNSNFIVREVKMDFNKNKVIITAYKA